MIEIVGKDESLKKQVTCRNCSSILKYLPVDVKTKTERDYGGGSDTYRYIPCPCCNNQIYL